MIIQRIVFQSIIIIIIIIHSLNAQTPGGVVFDFDGNSYNSVIIGDQVWLAENLKSTHYCDGTEIPDVVAYNNDNSLADIYGLLYTWNAAMNGTNTPNSQGACPCGWHVPSDDEWIELETFLGGANIAGGKMKEADLDHWTTPNTGADNSSGLTIIPAGEFDSRLNPPNFNLINDYAVFWTSSEVNAVKARERYLSYKDAKSSTFDWYKSLKYSIRCVKDGYTTSVYLNKSKPSNFEIYQNYPNPFNPKTTIEYYLPYPKNINISIYNLLGDIVDELYNDRQIAGYHKIEFNGTNLSSGIYFYKIQSEDYNNIKSCLLVK